MNDTVPSRETTSKEVRAFGDDVRIRPERLLKLIRLWRHLQAGSSHKKCKGHSTIN
jgi:hypothetical protein